MNTLFRHKALLIKLLISFSIIGLLAMRMNMAELKNITGQIHVEAWITALVLIFIQILALSYRWLLLLNVNGRKINYADSIRITLASLLANYLFITSIGGIVVRVILAIQHGVSLIKSIAATTLDRVMTVIGLLILAVLFVPVL